MTRRLWLALLLTAMLAGCRGPATPSTSLADVAGEWRLDHGTVDGVAIPIVAGSAITLSMNAPSIVGTSACNTWGGRLALVGDTIQITDIASTAMLCADDVMASEAAFMQAIERVNAATRDGASLTLLGPGVELVFDAA